MSFSETNYDEKAQAYLINNLNDLKAFRDEVNGGNNFAGKTVLLTADIDLNNEAWTPIGYDGKAFDGIFDGGNHKISNVNVNSTKANVGFFGLVGSNPEGAAALKNLTIENCQVTSSYKSVGGLVGCAYTGSVENCHVTGDIQVSGGWYVGGLNGGMTYAKYTDCSVCGNEGSVVQATLNGEYTNYVGGLIGLHGEGTQGIFNCDVSGLTLKTKQGYGIGGIVGVFQYATTIEGCSVSNVTIDSPSEDSLAWVGMIGGKNYSNSENGRSYLTNNEADSQTITTKVNGAVVQNQLIGFDYTGTYEPFDTYDANTVIGTGVKYDEAGKVVSGSYQLVGPSTTLDASIFADDAEITLNVTGMEDGRKIFEGTSFNGTITMTGDDGKTYGIEGEGIDAMVVRYVCSIGENKYRTMAEAIEAVKTGETIQILVDKIDETISLGTKSGVTVQGLEDDTEITSTLGGTLTDCTIKNLNFTNDGDALRYCYVHGTTTIDNCTFAQGGQYAIHFDGDVDGALIVKNSTITGTVALAATLQSTTFTNDTFAGRSRISGYCNINIYSNAAFDGCTFTDDYCSGGKRGILMLGDDTVITMDGCSMAEGSTKKLTDVFRHDYLNLGVIDGTKSGEVYTSGTLVATVEKINDNIADDITFVGNDRIAAYDISNKKVSVYSDAIADDFTVPDGYTLVLDEGIFTGTIDVSAGKKLEIDSDAAVCGKITVNTVDQITFKDGAESGLEGALILVNTVMTEEAVSEWKTAQGLADTVTVRALAEPAVTPSVIEGDVTIDLAENQTVTENVTSETGSAKLYDGTIEINSLGDNTEVRGDITQKGNYQIIVNNGNTEATKDAGSMAITGVITSEATAANTDVVINNGASEDVHKSAEEQRVLNGGNNETGFKVEANEITINNFGHAVVDLKGKKITIDNNSKNTLTGSVTGTDIEITASVSEGSVKDAAITAGTENEAGSLTFSDEQTIENSDIKVYSGSVTLSDSAVVTMDGYSYVEANAIALGAGATFTVDGTGFVGYAKVIDLNPGADLDVITVSNFAGFQKDTVNGDLYVWNADKSDMAVNADWSTGYEFGDEITVGEKTYYYGITAFSQMADAVGAVTTLPVNIIAYGNGNVGVTETASGEGTEFSVAGTYNISGTEWTNLGYLQTNHGGSPSATNRFVLNIGAEDVPAYLVMTKPQLRAASDLNITDSHVDFALQSSGSKGYLFAFQDSTVTIKDSVVGYCNNGTNNSASVVAGETSTSTQGMMATYISGIFSADNSTVFTMTDDSKAFAFSVYDKGLATFKDSVLYSGHVVIGNYEGRSDTDRGTAGRDGEIATISLDNSKIIKNNSDTYTLQVGTANRAGKLTMTNNSLIDYADIDATVNSNGIVNVSDSTLKAKTITNAGTVNVTGESSVTGKVTNTGTFNFGSKDATFKGTLTGNVNDDNTGYVNIVSGTLSLADQTVKAKEFTIGSRTTGIVDANTEAELIVGAGAVVSGNGSNGIWVGAADGEMETAETNSTNFQLIVDGGTASSGANGFTVRNTGYVEVRNGGSLTAPDASLRNNMLVTGTNSVYTQTCGNLYGETGITAEMTVEKGATANLGSFTLGGSGATRVNRRGKLTIDNATVNAGAITISAKNNDEQDVRGTISMTAANLNVTNLLDNNGSIVMDAVSKITVNSITNTSGTITVDMTGVGTTGKAVYKLVDASATSTYGTEGVNYKFATGKDNGYTFSVVNNDLLAIDWTKISKETLMVNDAWAEKAYGDEVQVDDDYYYIGINAFGTVDDAFAGQTDATTTIQLAGDAALNNTITVDKSITLDMAGYDLTVNASGYAFTTNAADVSLTITGGEGSEIISATPANVNGFIELGATDGNSAITISNVSFHGVDDAEDNYSDTASGAAMIWDLADDLDTAQISKITLNNVTVQTGGGILQSDNFSAVADVFVTGGTYTGNQGFAFGGTDSSEEGKYSVISGATINSTCDTAVYAITRADLIDSTVTRTTGIGNGAVGFGDDAELESENGYLKIVNTTVTNTAATGKANSSAVDVESKGKVVIVSGTFTGHGGNVLHGMTSGGCIEVNGGTIDGSDATYALFTNTTAQSAPDPDSKIVVTAGTVIGAASVSSDNAYIELAGGTYQKTMTLQEGNGQYVRITGNITLDVANNGQISYSGAILTEDYTDKKITAYMEDATAIYYKLADYTGSEAKTLADYSMFEFSNNTGANGDKYKFAVIDKDLYAISTAVSLETLKVNVAWSGLAFGTSVGQEGYYYGINAFSNVKDASAAITADTTSLVITDGIYNGDSSTIVNKGTSTLVLNGSYDGDQLYDGSDWTVGTEGTKPGDVTSGGVFNMETAQKYEIASGSDVRLIHFYTQKYGNAYVDVKGNLSTTCSIIVKAGTRMDIESGSTVIVSDEELPGTRGTTFLSYGETDVKGTLNVYASQSDSPFRIGLGTSYYTKDSAMKVDGGTVTVRGTGTSDPVQVIISAASTTTGDTAATLSVTNGGTFDTTGAIVNNGTISFDDAKLKAASITNNGLFEITGNDEIEDIVVSGLLTNYGTIRFTGNGEPIKVGTNNFTNYGTIEFSSLTEDSSTYAGWVGSFYWEDGSTLALTNGTIFDLDAQGNEWNHGITVDKTSQLIVSGGSGGITLQEGETLTLAFNAEATGENLQIRVTDEGVINTSAGSVTVDMTGYTGDSYTVLYGGDGSNYGTNFTVTGAAYTLQQMGNNLVATQWDTAPVASVTSADGKTVVYYETLAAAITAVEDGETITILSETIEIPLIKGTADKKYTIQGQTDEQGNLLTQVTSWTTSHYNDASLAGVTIKDLEINTALNTFNAGDGFTLKNCKFTGNGGAIQQCWAPNTSATMYLIDCVFEQKGTKGDGVDGEQCFHIDASGPTALKLVATNCKFRSKLNGGVDTATFTNCTFDGGETKNDGKYSAELGFRANKVVYTNCNFTEKFAASLTSATNADDNGINVKTDNEVIEFNNCKILDAQSAATSTSVSTLVGSLKSGSIVAIDAATASNKYTSGTFLANSISALNSHLAVAITGMDGLSGRIKYTIDDTTKTLTADYWTNGSSSYAATLSGTLTVPEGVTFTVAADATVAENTVIRLATVQGSEDYTNFVDSLTDTQKTNAKVQGWVCSVTKDQTTTNYYTMQEAFDAVTEGDTIKLLCNVTDTAELTAAKSFTLDLAGFNYSNTAKNGLVTVANTAITLTDSTTPAEATAFSAAITGAGSVVVDSTANVSLNNMTSAVTITNNGKLASDGLTLNNSLVSDGTLNLTDSTINVNNSATMPIETIGSTKYRNGVKLSGSATLTNTTIHEDIADNNYRERGVYVTGTGTDVQVIAEAEKTSEFYLSRAKTPTRSNRGWTYGISLGDGSDADNAGMTFSGAGNLNITGHTEGPDSTGQYGWSINGIRVNGENNTLTFANEGTTTITESSTYGVNGVCTYGTVNFTDGTVLINSYVDGGVAFSNNIGLYNSGYENSKFVVTDGVDEMTIFTEGAAYDAEEGSGDVSNGAAAIYESSKGGTTTINAKKLNILAVSGEDTNKEWTIGDTKVTGHTTFSAAKKTAVGATKYSTSYGIENDDTGSVLVGEDTVTNIHTRDFEKNSIAVASTGIGSIEILGKTTIVAEGGDGTYALYTENSGSITVGSADKTVDITGDILANGTYNQVASSITIAGSTNTVTGSIEAANGGIVNLNSITVKATTGDTPVGGNITIGEASTVKLADYNGTVSFNGAWNNAGTFTVDMTGATEVMYKLVESNDVTMTIDDYGTVSLMNGTEAADYTAMVLGNDLYAVSNTAAARIGDTYYATLQEAVNAAQDGDTVTVLKNITLTSRVDVAAEGKEITIDLNEYTITPTADCANGSAFNVVSGTVNFTDGWIDGTEITSVECDAITVRSGATANLNGMKIQIDSQTGACAYAFDGGTVNVNGGIYKNLTTEAYPYGGDSALIFNQANTEGQKIFVNAGTYTFVGKDPAKGDDSSATTGVTSFVGNAVASIGEIGEDKSISYYETLAEAYAAAEAGSVKTVKLLVSSIDSIAGIPAGVTLEGLSGKTTVTTKLDSATLDNVTFKNLKFTGDYGIYNAVIKNTVTITDCDFDQTGKYSLQSGEGTGRVVASGTTFRGWVSLGSTIENASFTDCVFLKNTSTNPTLHLYTDTSFTGCTFDSYFAASSGTLYLCDKNLVVTLDDCEVNGGAAVADMIYRRYLYVPNKFESGCGDGSVVVIDGDKDSSGKYTSGTFVAAQSGIVNLNEICADSADLTFLDTNNCFGTFTYVVPAEGTKTLTAETKLKGIVKVPADVNLVIGDYCGFLLETKLYIPYDHGSTALETWKDNNLTAYQKQTVSVNGWVCSVTKDQTTTKYYTLEDAIDAVEEGQTIQMLVDEISEQPVFGETTKAFTIQGLENDYTKIPGAARSGSATTSNVTFKNIDWTAAFDSVYMNNVTFQNCKFSGDDNAVRNCGVYGDWTFDHCTFAQEGKYAVHFAEDGNGGGTVTFKNNCVISGKVTSAALTKSVSFSDCTIDGGAADDEGKYIAEIGLRANVTFTGCTFTQKFADGISATYNQDDNGINVRAGYTCSFTNCTIEGSAASVSTLVGELGEGSAATFYTKDGEEAAVLKEVVADSVTTLNAQLTAAGLTAITGMDGLTDRVKYTIDGTTKTLTADYWTNGKSTYNANLSGTLTVPEGVTFAVADNVTVTSGTKIYLSCINGSDAYNTFVNSLEPAQSDNCKVYGWVAAIGDTKYYTMQDAFSAVTEGQTIKLLCSIEDTTALTTKSDVSFSIDLAGFNYSNTSTLTNNGTVTITDSTETTDNRFTVGTLDNKGTATLKKVIASKFANYANTVTIVDKDTVLAADGTGSPTNNGIIYGSDGVVTIGSTGTAVDFRNGTTGTMYNGTSGTEKLQKLVVGGRLLEYGTLTLGTLELNGNQASGYYQVMSVNGASASMTVDNITVTSGFDPSKGEFNGNYQMSTMNGATLTVNNSMTTGEFMNAGTSGDGKGKTILATGATVNAYDFQNRGKYLDSARIEGDGATLNAAMFTNSAYTSLGTVNLKALDKDSAISSNWSALVDEDETSELKIGTLNITGDYAYQFRLSDKSKFTVGSLSVNVPNGFAFYVTDNSDNAVNANGQGTVKMTGDIVFATYSDSASDEAKFALNLSTSDSYFTGAVKGTVSQSAKTTSWAGNPVNGDEVADNTHITGMTISISGGAAWNVTDDSFVNSITIGNSSYVNMTKEETITYNGTWTNNGTFTVDMTGATETFYKLVDYTGDGTVTSYGNVELTNAGDYSVYVYGNDLYASKVPYTTSSVAVKSLWQYTEDGTVVELNGREYIVGFNAFADLSTAFSTCGDNTIVNLTISDRVMLEDNYELYYDGEIDTSLTLTEGATLSVAYNDAAGKLYNFKNLWRVYGPTETTSEEGMIFLDKVGASTTSWKNKVVAGNKVTVYAATTAGGEGLTTLDVITRDEEGNDDQIVISRDITTEGTAYTNILLDANMEYNGNADENKDLIIAGNVTSEKADSTITILNEEQKEVKVVGDISANSVVMTNGKGGSNNSGEINVTGKITASGTGTAEGSGNLIITTTEATGTNTRDLTFGYETHEADKDLVINNASGNTITGGTVEVRGTAQEVAAIFDVGGKATVTNSGNLSTSITAVEKVTVTNAGTIDKTSIETEDEVVISNTGHMEADVFAEDKITVTKNSSLNSLTTTMKAPEIEITNDGGAIRASTLIAYGTDDTTGLGEIIITGSGTSVIDESALYAGYSSAKSIEGTWTGYITLKGTNAVNGTTTFNGNLVNDASAALTIREAQAEDPGVSPAMKVADVSVTGNLTNGTSAALTVDETTEITVTGTMSNAGTLNVNGTMTTGAVTSNTGAVTVAGSLTTGAFTGTAGAVTVSGTMNTDDFTTGSDAVTVSGTMTTDAFTATGAVEVSGTLTANGAFSAGNVTVNGGTLSSGTYSFTAADVEVAAESSLTSGAFDASGAVTVSGTLNSSTFEADGAVTVSGSLTTTGNVTASGAISVDGGTVNTTGDFTATGAGTASSITNGTVTVSGTYTNSNALTLSDNSEEVATKLTVGSFTNNGGTLTIGNNTVLEFSGEIEKGTGDKFITAASYGDGVIHKVIEYTGTGSVTQGYYTSLVSDWSTDKYVQIGNDLYVFGGDNKIYVNSNYTESAGSETKDHYVVGSNAFSTFAAAQEKVGTSTGITIVSTSCNEYSNPSDFTAHTEAMNFCKTILEGTDTKYYMIAGGKKLTTGTAGVYTPITKDVDLTIKGGSFESNVIGGTIITQGSVHQTGDINLTINGGTFGTATNKADVAGGMYFAESSYMDQTYLVGNINLTINGGTFSNYVYGGSFSQADDLYSMQNKIIGNINVVVNAANEITIGGSLIAGSRSMGVVNGNTKVTLTGTAENLHVGKNISGGSGSDGYYSDGSAFTLVTGTRTLEASSFNGVLDARLVMFNKVTMTNSAVVLDDDTDSQLFEVNAWTMNNSSLTGDFGTNDFTGDTINLNYADASFDENGEATVFDAATADQISGWNASSTSVNINGTAATLTGNKWVAGNYSFGLDDNDATKLVITKSTLA